MAAMKAANKDLKGTMKTLKIDDIDKMQDEMMDLVDYSSEIQETLGRSYNVPDDLDEEELMGELESLEADMGLETGTDVPSYLLPDKEPEFDSEIQLPAAPSGPAAPQANPQAADEYGFPTVPRTSLRT
jgi:charged multivesicular body protein 5